MAIKKLYCFVDESGQDTEGEIFVVSVVVTSEQKDKLLQFCERIEKVSGKGKVKWHKPTSQFTTLIYVDGLARAKRHEYGARLRQLGIPTRKVQGVPKDENNALIRLADAIAGFVRDALEDKSEEISTLFRRAKRDGVLIEVSS